MATTELDDRGVIVSCPNCRQKNRVLFERLSDPFRCGQCKRELSPPSEPIEIGTPYRRIVPVLVVAADGPDALTGRSYPPRRNPGIMSVSER
jgi:hypothetical protein